MHMIMESFMLSLLNFENDANVIIPPCATANESNVCDAAFFHVFPTNNFGKSALEPMTPFFRRDQTSVQNLTP